VEEYDQMLSRMEAAGIDVSSGGQQTEEAIARLETLISHPLPASYRRFVAEYGFAGPEENPYKGIYENDPAAKVGESAYYHTCVLRGEWGLPSSYLVVNYEHDLEMATCIDLADRDGDECAIVVVEYRSGELDVSIESSSFQESFLRHMEQLIEAEEEWNEAEEES